MFLYYEVARPPLELKDEMEFVMMVERESVINGTNCDDILARIACYHSGNQGQILTFINKFSFFYLWFMRFGFMLL